MATQVGNAQQARVTLRSLTESIQPAERIIILNDAQRKVSIGRASKSASKGLLAAADNAWFNSPVMSRKHAELFLDDENGFVMIQDTGALHGTRLNHAPLRLEKPTRIFDGDLLIFGVEVRRGPESFPACSFRINYEMESSSPSMNTIKFPESSDVEEEEEDYESEKGLNSDEAEDTPIESPPHSHTNLSAVHETIDLTEDSEQCYMGPRGLSEDEICTDAAAINLEKLRSNATYDKPYEISEDEQGGSGRADCYDEPTKEPVYDYGDEYADIPDSQYDSESEPEDEDENCSIPDSFDTEDGHEGHVKSHEDENTETLGFADGAFPPSNMRSSFVEPEHMPFPVKEKSSISFGRIDICCGSNGSTTKEQGGDAEKGSLDTPFEFPKATYEDEWGYSDIKSTCAGGLIPVVSFEDDWGYSDIKSTGVDDESLGTTGDYPAPESSSSSQADKTICPSRPTTQEEEGVATHPRKHSPSSSTLQAIPVHLLPSDDWKAVTRKALGDKTGKQAYFEAREKNRKNIMNAIDQLPSKQGLPFGYQTCCSDCDETRQPSSSVSPEDIDVQRERISTIVVDNPNAFASPPTNRASSTIDTSPQKNSNKAPSPPSICVVPPSKAAKRKADAISDLQKDEMRAWAESNDGVSSISPEVSLPSQTSAAVDTDNAAISEQRTSKRLKSFAEAVGYAALGGVAVGAGLFSVLVATAPDFI